jgi:FkbM family methyltransferase
MDSADTDRLIVDLGMYNGDDTDFYLRKGFRVLAVEAAPHHVEPANARFRDAIDTGRLTILNVAVADHEGEIDFFLSEEDMWASTRADMAGRFGALRQKIVVPCATLDKILVDYPTPYYLKIDIEGVDRDCIESLRNLPEKPRFVSFEADLDDPGQTLAMLSTLASYGYHRFKLVNQATHSVLRMPQPPLEGRYVDARFNKHMSGPFGKEAPGSWMSLEQVSERYSHTIRRQAAQIEYAAKGTLYGVPMGWFRRPLRWLYNTPAATRARMYYATRRGVEVGGWFDIHAAL